MNHYIFIVVTSIVITCMSRLFCCPTCIGRVEKDSAAFFTKEFYAQADNKALQEDHHYTKK